MLINVLDVILSSPYFIFISLSIISIWIAASIEKHSGSKLAILFFVFFVSIIFPTFAFWGTTYTLLRTTGEEASYFSMITSLDFSGGLVLSIAPLVSLFIIIYFVIYKINYKFLLRNAQDTRGAEMTTNIVVIILIAALYGISTLGNCLLYEITGFGQHAFFDYDGPTINIIALDSSLFTITPKCNLVDLENINIYSSPIRMSNFLSTNISNTGASMKEIINILIKIISPIADIVGIYQFIESRFNKKKKKEVE